jgi:Base plate wedge protein 53
MTYFETLPTIIYEFSTGERSVIDIFSRVAMKPSFFANTSFYTTEQLETVLRPDQLSYEKYGEFKYYWLLLLVNKIYDIHRDWPVQQEVFGTALEKLQNKKVYYIYQNVEIVPNDILYFSDTSYGVIESWNPFYKEIVIKEGYGVLPTSNFTTAEIRRVTSASTGKFIKLTNYCDSSDPLITTTAINIIGYSPFLEAPAQFIDGSNRAVNPFIGATGGTIQVPNIIIMDTCSEEDRTLFQSTILSRIINDLNVTGIKVKTKEDVFISEYYNKIKLNIINSEIVPIILNKANILITDTPETATTLVRID